MLRRFIAVTLLLALAACADGGNDLTEPPVALGDFKLGHNVAIAAKARQGPLSRKATEEQLATAIRKAVAERFGRYQGESLYHFGISVEGYVLAAPGIPLVLSPKSVMIVNVTVWDDAAGKKLNDEPHQITVLESFGTGALIGSGYTLTPDKQLEQLSRNAVKAVERYLVKKRKEEGWFGQTPTTPAGVPGAEPAEVPLAAPAETTSVSQPPAS